MTPAAKRLKEASTAPLGVIPSAGATPSAVGGEDGEASASLTQPPSRGQLGHPSEELAPVASLDLESAVPDAGAMAAKAQEVPSCQAVVTLPPTRRACQGGAQAPGEGEGDEG